jgi:hypothetical protein
MTQYSNFLQRKNRNALWNGNFTSWPEGLTTFTNSNTAAMTVVGSNFDSGVVVPSGTDTTKPNENCIYVHRMTATTGEATVTGSEYSHLLIRVEGYDFLPFIGKRATLSFWVRASVTGTHSISFRNTGGDRSYITEYTINQADTWEYKVVHVTFDYSGGTWDYTNGIGINVIFTPCCGTTYATSTTDEWVTGNYIASTNQVNTFATTGNTFYLSQCQLELGDVASEYEHLDAALLARMSYRYYQNIYQYHAMGTQVSNGSGNNYTHIDYIVPMRTIPTITASGDAIWSGATGWRSVTSRSFGNAQTFRSMGIFADSTYSPYTSLWALLMYGSLKLDARL